MELMTFGSGQGYLKAGFLGFAKSGKTYTAALLALALSKHLNLTGPIAIFDTESGGEYIAPMIERETGMAPIGFKGRALSDLLAVSKECEAGAASILIVDSVTHVWREVCAAYLEQINRSRVGQGRGARSRLEFQDWAIIKARWNDWTDVYLNANLHIIICGRAGYEWDFEEREDAAGNIHKELVKKGVKMKVETEFGFEPSLLVEMVRTQVPDDTVPDRFRLTHRARVLGDRFDVMDGQVTDNPSGAWFAPHLDMLVPGAENKIDTAPKTDMGVDESGDAKFRRERRERTIALEEIEQELVAAFPSTKAVDKQAKITMIEKHFATKSWTKVKSMPLRELRAGLDLIRADIKALSEKGEDE